MLQGANYTNGMLKICIEDLTFAISSYEGDDFLDSGFDQCEWKKCNSKNYNY